MSGFYLLDASSRPLFSCDRQALLLYQSHQRSFHFVSLFKEPTLGFVNPNFVSLFYSSSFCSLLFYFTFLEFNLLFFSKSLNYNLNICILRTPSSQHGCSFLVVLCGETKSKALFHLYVDLGFGTVIFIHQILVLRVYFVKDKILFCQTCTTKMVGK